MKLYFLKLYLVKAIFAEKKIGEKKMGIKILAVCMDITPYYPTVIKIIYSHSLHNTFIRDIPGHVINIYILYLYLYTCHIVGNQIKVKDTSAEFNFP